MRCAHVRLQQFWLSKLGNPHCSDADMGAGRSSERVSSPVQTASRETREEGAAIQLVTCATNHHRFNLTEFHEPHTGTLNCWRSNRGA
jgi:hypothetical protein